MCVCICVCVCVCECAFESGIEMFLDASEKTGCQKKKSSKKQKKIHHQLGFETGDNKKVIAALRGTLRGYEKSP